MNVYTNKYVRAHGIRPRGRGQWAFKIGMMTFWFPDHNSHDTMMYSEARAKAIAKAKELKEFSVTLLP